MDRDRVQKVPHGKKSLFYTMWVPGFSLVIVHLVGIVPLLVQFFDSSRFSWRPRPNFVEFSLEQIGVFFNSWYVTGWGYAIIPATLAVGIGVGWMLDNAGFSADEGEPR